MEKSKRYSIKGKHCNKKRRKGENESKKRKERE